MKRLYTFLLSAAIATATAFAFSPAKHALDPGIAQANESATAAKIAKVKTPPPSSNRLSATMVKSSSPTLHTAALKLSGKPMNRMKAASTGLIRP